MQLSKLKVDVFVVNRNTLPWLKLLVSQVERYKPLVDATLYVWDNASTDGSREWLKAQGIRHHLHHLASGHADGLVGLFERSDAPYVAYLDVDAFPIRPGWLDEAVLAGSNEKTGAAGLRSRLPDAAHRPFIHPCFMVFRRDLYRRLSLSPHIVHEPILKIICDVGEAMCRRIEDEGYALHDLGEAWLPSVKIQTSLNKVVHAWTSYHILNDINFPEHAVRSYVERQREPLVFLGLWEKFLGYARESLTLNALCARYL